MRRQREAFRSSYAWIFLALIVFTSRAFGLDVCSAVLDRLEGKALPSAQEYPLPSFRRAPDSFEGLLRAFSEGLIPNFNVPDEANAFLVYRILRFGNASTNLVEDPSHHVAEHQAMHPEVGKKPFPNIGVTLSPMKAPPRPEISSLVQTVKKLSERIATEGYWKELLPNNPTLAQTIAEHTAKVFGAKPEPRELLDLFSRLKAYHATTEEFSTRQSLAKAIIDVVTITAFASAKRPERFQSEDGIVQLQSLRNSFDERDAVAMQLGYPGHFEELLHSFAVDAGTSLPPERELEAQLRSIAEQVESTKKTRGMQSRRLVRHLTLAESPARSCLGGTDCSSNTYPKKALQETYHYFTITDPITGNSNGHMTITLGTSRRGDKTIPVAFIDKLMNVDADDIPWFIEAVRQSVALENYVLALPSDFRPRGEGLSNMLSIMDAINDLAAYKNQPEILYEFEEDSSRVDYSNENSRKYSSSHRSPSVKAVLPLGESAELAFENQGSYLPWRMEPGTLKLETLLENAYAKKSSAALEDKLRYVTLMATFSRAVPSFVDPEFYATCQGWLKTKETPIKLKNRILTERFNQKPSSVLSAAVDARVLTSEEQGNLIQNWMQTPNLRSAIFEGITNSTIGSQITHAVLALAVNHEGTLQKLLTYILEYERWADLAKQHSDCSPQGASMLLRCLAAVADARQIQSLEDVLLPSFSERLQREVKANIARGQRQRVLQGIDERTLKLLSEGDAPMVKRVIDKFNPSHRRAWQELEAIAQGGDWPTMEKLRDELLPATIHATASEATAQLAALGHRNKIIATANARGFFVPVTTKATLDRVSPHDFTFYRDSDYTVGITTSILTPPKLSVYNRLLNKKTNLRNRFWSSWKNLKIALTNGGEPIEAFVSLMNGKATIFKIGTTAVETFDLKSQKPMGSYLLPDVIRGRPGWNDHGRLWDVVVENRLLVKHFNSLRVFNLVSGNWEHEIALPPHRIGLKMFDFSNGVAALLTEESVIHIDLRNGKAERFPYKGFHGGLRKTFFPTQAIGRDADGRILVPYDGQLHAIDLATGDVSVIAFYPDWIGESEIVPLRSPGEYLLFGSFGDVYHLKKERSTPVSNINWDRTGKVVNLPNGNFLIESKNRRAEWTYQKFSFENTKPVNEKP